MKKIIFLQIKGKSFGGIWLVNKTLGEAFIKKGYEVQVCSIRDNHPGNFEETSFKQHTINTVDEWPFIHRRDVLKSLSGGFREFLKTFKQYLSGYFGLKNDYKKMKKYINLEKPDYIIASHYQTLFGIPKKYLKKTVHVQHSSFGAMKMDNKNVNVLKKYNNKLFSLLWLSFSTYKLAENFGFVNNKCIYNPARIVCDENPDVIKNKRIVVLSRYAPEKRIDLMVKMVNEVFRDSKYKDWSFYIFGQGDLSSDTKKIINSSKQIFESGVASDVKKELVKSSISLNTSLFEGFPMSLIESFTCGIPAVIFDYGESAREIIHDGYNGFVVNQNETEKFKERLREVLDNPDLLVKMSLNSKEYAQKFKVDNIISDWEKLFLEIDNR